MEQIQIFNLFPAPFLKNRKGLKRFLSQQLKDTGYHNHRVNVIFCDDEYLLAINQQHLQHDYYTDIITFDLTHPSDQSNLEGELYISIERVKDNAKTSNQLLQTELLRVVFHGFLHLLGYKDKSPKDISQMRAKENEWIEQYTILH